MFSDKIKVSEKRLKEISNLQKHIGTYSKTREVYVEYRKSGYIKKFLASHESDIILHKTAKAEFDKLGLQKLPNYADAENRICHPVNNEKQAVW